MRGPLWQRCTYCLAVYGVTSIPKRAASYGCANQVLHTHIWQRVGDEAQDQLIKHLRVLISQCEGSRRDFFRFTQRNHLNPKFYGGVTLIVSYTAAPCMLIVLMILGGFSSPSPFLQIPFNRIKNERKHIKSFS